MNEQDQHTCNDCFFWEQPEWLFKCMPSTKPENFVTGFCTWHPDYDKIPYYLKAYYCGINGDKNWEGAVQHRDSEACPVFQSREHTTTIQILKERESNSPMEIEYTMPTKIPMIDEQDW